MAVISALLLPAGGHFIADNNGLKIIVAIIFLVSGYQTGGKGFKLDNGGGTMDGFTESLLDGDINWKAVMSALRATGYDGPASAEILGSDPLDTLALICKEMAQIFEGTV